jgi:hypothetical protein
VHAGQFVDAANVFDDWIGISNVPLVDTVGLNPTGKECVSRSKNGGGMLRAPL